MLSGFASEDKDGTRLSGVGAPAHPSEPEVLLLQAVSRALMAWDPLEPGARYLLSEMATALALAGAVLWCPHDEDLLPLAFWMREPVDRWRFEQGLLGPDANRWSHLARLARERAGPVLDIEDCGSNTRPRQSLGPGSVRAVLAVPAKAGAETVGVVVGYGAELRGLAAPSLETLGAVGQLLGDLLQRWQFQEDHARLTRRELELVTLASRGLTTAKIAARLSLSPWTVKTHFEHIRLKLKAPDRAAAVAHALRTGMIV